MKIINNSNAWLRVNDIEITKVSEGLPVNSMRINSQSDIKTANNLMLNLSKSDKSGITINASTDENLTGKDIGKYLKQLAISSLNAITVELDDEGKIAAFRIEGLSPVGLYATGNKRRRDSKKTLIQRDKFASIIADLRYILH